MTRGKYATRAARRREDADVQTEIGTYRHHVARLTGQVAELRAQLDAERAGRKNDARRFAAQLDEGISPELTALRAELERQRQRARQAEDARRRAKERDWNRLRGMLALLRDGLGLTHVEAREVIATFDPEFLADVDGDQRYAAMMADYDTDPGGLTLEQIHGLQAARGMRHRADVVKFLRDKIDAARAQAARS